MSTEIKNENLCHNLAHPCPANRHGVNFRQLLTTLVNSFHDKKINWDEIKNTRSALPLGRTRDVMIEVQQIGRPVLQGIVERQSSARVTNQTD